MQGVLSIHALKGVVQSAAGRFGLELRNPVRRRRLPKGAPRVTEDGIGEEYFRPYPLSRYYPLWTVIADRIRRAGLHRVLEIGCGNGRLAAALLDQGGVQQYVGLDFSPVFIKMARALVPGAQFVIDDARTSSVYTDFAPEAVVCTEMLEHVEEDLLVVSRFPVGARCLCSVPDFPGENHFRHFRDTREVAARYGSFFSELDVVGFKGATGSGVGMYFLFDGVRNER